MDEPGDMLPQVRLVILGEARRSFGITPHALPAHTMMKAVVREGKEGREGKGISSSHHDWCLLSMINVVNVPETNGHI